MFAEHYKALRDPGPKRAFHGQRRGISNILMKGHKLRLGTTHKKAAIANIPGCWCMEWVQKARDQ